MKTAIKLILGLSIAFGAQQAAAHDPEPDMEDIRASLVQRGLFDLNPHVDDFSLARLFRVEGLRTDDRVNELRRDLVIKEDLIDVEWNPIREGELAATIDVGVNLGMGLSGPPHLRD